MKKHIFLGVLLMLTGFFFIPSKTFAFQHAYESKSDFIYALARNELPVYYSDYSYASRGLGDVYKRQLLSQKIFPVLLNMLVTTVTPYAKQEKKNI